MQHFKFVIQMVFLVFLVMSSWIKGNDVDGIYSQNSKSVQFNCIQNNESSNYFVNRTGNIVNNFNPTFFPVELNQERMNNKINALNLHRMKFESSPYSLDIDVLSSVEYETQKPTDALPLDCGYVDANGKVFVSEPITTEQLEVFNNIDQAAIYYMCQSFLQYYYQTTEMPIWFKSGFASYESDMRLDDNDIKIAYNNYGGTLTSFDILNNPTTFSANNGFAVSYIFGEFLGVYKVWEYYGITVVNGTTIESNIGNAESIEKLFDMWLRYFNVRILEENEENRVKMGKETEHFKFYYRSSEEYWAAAFTDILEDALAEYMGLMEFEVFEKFSYFTMPECDGALLIEGVDCISRYTGGTAWSSGLSSTSPDTDNDSDIERFRGLIRHELGHLTQSQLPQGTITQWLNEGYPSFMEGRPLTQEEIPQLQAATEQAIIDVTNFFGHLPSFEETKIYAGSSYDYYLLGVILLNFIYEDGGYSAIKEIMIDYETGIANLGYSSLEEYMTAYYYYLDIRMLYKNVATLNTSLEGGTIYSSTLELNWTPLNPDVALNVSYSIDGGIQWTEIENNTTETNAMLEFPADFYGEFYLKFSTPSVLNLETIYGPFQRVNADIPTLLSQLGGEILIAGDIENIQWGYTNVTTINIEYSNDNGVNWNEIVSGISGTLGNYEWVIPNENSNQCMIKISDAANQANFDISENTFKILTPNIAGGPYAVDDNTMLLLHLNGNFQNKSSLSDDGILNGSGALFSFADNPELGESINLDGSSYVTVPHNTNLNLSGDWTIEAWIKVTAYPTNTSSIIVRKPGDTDSYSSNYAFEIHPFWGNVFHGFYFPDAQTRINVTGVSPALNTWYHVAFIRDTGNSKISIIVHDENWDVVSTSSNTYTTNDVFLNSQDIRIGESFNGYIDELRISNVVRDFNSVIEVDDKMTIPEEYVLHQNYPNPFNPSTMIQYGLPERSNVRVEVFNMLGQSVALLVNSDKSAGYYETTWDASNLPSGIYIISIRANGINSEKNFVQVNKALLIK